MKQFIINLSTFLISFSALYAQEEIPPEPSVSDRPITIVDKDAEFPGGIDRFRTLFSELVDRTKVDCDAKLLSANVMFTVDIDGTITKLEIKGENESLNKEIKRAIENIDECWQPASYQGVPQQQGMRMPVRFDCLIE